jgi:hypothetical protein
MSFIMSDLISLGFSEYSFVPKSFRKHKAWKILYSTSNTKVTFTKCLYQRKPNPDILKVTCCQLELRARDGTRQLGG